MNKQDALVACETFRQSVMLSANSLPVDAEIKAALVVRFQGFYLSMLQELIDSRPLPTPPA
jgi:hypothetical protein